MIGALMQRRDEYRPWVIWIDSISAASAVRFQDVRPIGACLVVMFQFSYSQSPFLVLMQFIKINAQNVHLHLSCPTEYQTETSEPFRSCDSTNAKYYERGRDS